MDEYKLEKVFDFKNSPFTSKFQDLMCRCLINNGNNIRIADKILCLSIPESIKEKITSHFLNIYVRCGRSEENLNDCEKMSNEYIKDQTTNPTFYYLENIYDLICWQIRSSREAKEILLLLINESFENDKNNNQFQNWCNDKFKNSNRLFDLYNWSYEIRGKIDHPNSVINSTIFKYDNNKLTKPVIKISNLKSDPLKIGYVYDPFELGKNILEINFLYQKMCIELGFLYSKYLTVFSDNNILFKSTDF